ncbi:MAG: porin [Janthinobacterium lividum]
MKKALLAGAVLAMLTPYAFAQSSVTLYGVIDEGLDYVNNTQVAGATGRRQASRVFLTTGILQGDRWGLKAVEDLGGGLQTIAVLESGWDINTGALQQGNALFGRQAYVGLAGKDGSVMLGRQYDILLDYVSPAVSSDSWGGAYAAHVEDLDNLNNGYRVNNAIKFKTATIAGFSVGGMYSVGGVAGDLSRNQIFGAGASYSYGPLFVGAAYMNARDPNISVYGSNPSGGNNTVNNFGATALTGVQGNPAISGYASAHTRQIIAAGASYKLGKGTFLLNYSNVRFSGLGDLTAGPNPLGYTGSASFNTAELGYFMFVTPALLIGGNYSFTKGSGPDGMDAKYSQIEIGSDYFLSKRTDLYALVTGMKASGRDSTGQAAVASINLLTPSTNDKQLMVRLAIRHKF